MKKDHYLRILECNITGFVEECAYPEEEIIFQQDEEAYGKNRKGLAFGAEISNYALTSAIQLKICGLLKKTVLLNTIIHQQI